MKLRRDDQVMVISGRDKGKTGKVLVVLPAENKVLVENINVVKRHTKPSQKQPRGGILEIAKPINAAKVMAVDPATGKPARIGIQKNADGSKERVFKVAHHADRKPVKAKKADAGVTEKKEAKPADKEKKS
jgi:large subunit ribosomal protein L24